jgi:release factor glutamine methyltransferase
MVGDWAEALIGSVDVIVSNPPYIRRDDIAGLPVEVGKHDPILALDGGDDGFSGHRAVLESAWRLLNPKGLLVLETGYDQARPLGELAAGRGWKVSIHKDLSRVERVLEMSRF